MLLIKGVSGDLDHWVLGDSLLKTFYMIFDIDNYRLGLVTNELTLGSEHEDLITLYSSLNFLPKSYLKPILIVLLVATLGFVLALGIVRWRKRRQGLLQSTNKGDTKQSEIELEPTKKHKFGRRRSAELKSSPG